MSEAWLLEQGSERAPGIGVNTALWALRLELSGQGLQGWDTVVSPICITKDH